MLLELLAIYAWTIAAGALAAVTLSSLGSQIAARDKSVQTLCVGQGAMLGVLIGIGLTSAIHGTDSEFYVHAGPFIFSVLVSLLIGLFGLRLEKKERASKNTYFIALFSILLALNYLASALFPGLESHMAQVFFGDLATLTETDIWITIVFSFIVFCVQLATWKKSSNQSFEVAILGAQFVQKSKSLKFVDALAFVYICFAIQFLGFLFTIATLFLPTIVLTLWPTKGLAKHLNLVGGISCVGVVLGFSMSLQYTKMPTVPTISVSLLLVGMITALFTKSQKAK